MKKVYVGDLLKRCPEDLSLKLVAGEKGVRKKALLPEIQKVGLALTGYSANTDPGKIQVFGKTEISYLKRLSATRKKEMVRGMFEKKAAAYLVTCGNRPLKVMVDEARRLGVPLLTSPTDTIRCIKALIRTIEELVAVEVYVHGVLVDIMGVGVLITGSSGIGKSECALELVVRGHRLVSDDVVAIKKLGDGRLVGTGSDIIRYHMEVRGLGIINIKDLFGISSIKSKKTLDLLVELDHWDEQASYDRLGIEEHRREIAGVSLPCLRMPVTPGRNIAVIVEVAARNHALKAQGKSAAAELDKKLARRIKGGAR